MALKTILDSLNDVPEAFRDEYKEQGDKFVLDIEGIDAHPTVVNLKTAFERVKADKKKLGTDLEAATARLAEVPEDFDAEEWVRLKAEAGDPDDPDKDKKKDEHLQSQKKVFEQRIANLEAKHAKDLAAKDTEIAERDDVISSVLVEDGLTKALVEAGVAKEYLKASRAMLKPSVKVVRDEDGSRRAIVETDLGEEEIGKYVASWSQSDEGKVFVAKPTGGDATGSHGRPGDSTTNPFGKAGWSKTGQARLVRENRAKAEQLAKAAGFKTLEHTFAASGPIAA